MSNGYIPIDFGEEMLMERMFLFLLLLYSASTNAGYRLQQTMEGRSFKLQCHILEKALKDINYDDIEKMEWRKDGDVIAFYTKTRTNSESWVTDSRIIFDRGHFSLTIDPLIISDSGQYKCWPRFRALPHWMKTSHWDPDVINLSVLGKPAMPGRPVVLSHSSRNVLLSWGASTSHEDAPISQYIIKSIIGGSNIIKEDMSTGNGTSWLITGLRPLALYRFEVAAENSVGRGPFSEPSYPIRMRGDAPDSPPKIVSAYNSTSTSLVIIWRPPPPESLYGQLNGYRLSVKSMDAQDEKELYIAKSDDTTYEIPGLLPYTKYMITLEAENAFGFSPPSTILVLTSEGVPPIGPNIALIRVLSSSSVSLTFSPPNITRGIIIHYTLHYRLVDQNRLYTDHDPNGMTSVKIYASIQHENIIHYRLENLEPCKKYSLWITASTSRGESPPSDIRNFTTDTIAPSHPNIINVSIVGVNSVYIEWSLPEKYCFRVDFYLVFVVDDKLNRRQLNISETPVHLNDLELLSRYAVSIRAASRSILITDRQRYYVGPESSSVRLILLPAPVPSHAQTSLKLRTSLCPLHVDQSRTVSSNVIYCDENLPLTAGSTMATINNTNQDNEPRPDTHSSTAPKNGVPVVAVAVLGTFGLLILLVLLIMVLVHFWRRYFGGKDCLAYAAEAIDGANARSYRSNMEYCDDSDCESVATEDFVDYVKSMHADSDSGFARSYERVEQVCVISDQFQKLSYEHSTMGENKMKNRYVNILAYDHSRVRLRSLPGIRNSDYINASFVDGFRQRRAYIATQGPLPNTIADFWRMVWEEKCSVIVMITNIIERGRKKCEQYWPSEGEETYGNFAVALLNEHIMAFYTVRTMTLRCVKKKSAINESNRIVMQYHCTGWPDHGVPESAPAVLKFIQKSTAANHDPSAPIVVHCSAGVGRSGTYIVIDSMLRQMRATGRINVCGFLKRIRHQRMCLVQTEEQYIFCHDAIAKAILTGDTEIAARDFRRIISEWLSEPDSESILKKQYEVIMDAKTLPCSEAKKPYNSRKNRDGAPIPNDDYRVVISAIPGEPGSDYINATFFAGYHRTDEFIITQFPMEETRTSFWQLVWDHNCRVIILLMEPDQVFQQFWPKSESMESLLDCGSFSVSLLGTSRTDTKWNCNELLLRSTREDFQLMCRLVCCTGWSTTMDDSNEVWRFIHSVQEKYLSDDYGPLVVVDACGGREAACLCLLSALNCQLDQEGCVDVYTLARCYHERRPGVFKELADYLYIFDCLDTLLLCYESKHFINGATESASHSCAAATRSRSLPSSLRAKSTSSLASRPPSCNGYCYTLAKDTTL